MKPEKWRYYEEWLRNPRPRRRYRTIVVSKPGDPLYFAIVYEGDSNYPKEQPENLTLF